MVIVENLEDVELGLQDLWLLFSEICMHEYIVFDGKIHHTVTFL